MYSVKDGDYVIKFEVTGYSQINISCAIKRIRIVTIGDKSFDEERPVDTISRDVNEPSWIERIFTNIKTIEDKAEKIKAEMLEEAQGIISRDKARRELVFRLKKGIEES